MELWLVVITSNNVAVVHSHHSTYEKANHWADCKKHDGEDVAIVHMGRDDAEELYSTLDRHYNPEGRGK